MRVVVAGAGISGLALSRALLARGIDVLVLEAEARAGGKVKTERAQGFVCEDGPGSYLADAAAQALLRDMGLEDRTVRPAAARKRFLCIGGKVLRAPASPTAFLWSQVIGWPSKLRALGEILLPRGPAGRGEDESVAAFARRRLGRGMADRLVAAAVSGIYAGDPEAISLPAAFPVLADWEREHRSLILGALRMAKRGRRAREIASFAGGMQEATDALARDLGERLRLGAAARRVEREGADFRVRVEERGSAGELVADAVVLALPAYGAAEACGHLDAPAGDALRAIPYAPVAIVHLGFLRDDVAHPADGFGYLVPPGERRPLLGALFPSSLFPGRAPDGSVLLTALLGGATRPELVALSDAALVDLALSELRTTLGVHGAPRLARVVRHERAIPQYTLGHRERVAAVEAAEARLPGLFFAGNAYRGISFVDCLHNAAPLAGRVAAVAAQAR
jgi:protoporphyrinogen/coproporphyrinogen III oxidase